MRSYKFQRLEVDGNFVFLRIIPVSVLIKYENFVTLTVVLLGGVLGDCCVFVVSSLGLRGLNIYNLT